MQGLMQARLIANPSHGLDDGVAVDLSTKGPSIQGRRPHARLLRQSLNLIAMASNSTAMASIAMASNLIAMASKSRVQRSDLKGFSMAVGHLLSCHLSRKAGKFPLLFAKFFKQRLSIH